LPPAEFDRERTIIQRYVASRPMFLDLSDEVAGRGASAGGKFDVAAQMKPLQTLFRCGCTCVRGGPLAASVLRLLLLLVLLVQLVLLLLAAAALEPKQQQLTGLLSRPGAYGGLAAGC
jgi:hypothetical protein